MWLWLITLWSLEKNNVLLINRSMQIEGTSKAKMELRVGLQMDDGLHLC